MNEHLYGFPLPVDISTHGAPIDHIFYVMHIFMIVLFVGWLGFFLYTLFRFRARPGHKATYAPAYTKFSTYLEVGIALFEAGVLIVLAIPAWKLAKASVPTGKDIYSIRIIAEQFAWNIHYPGDDGVFGRTDTKLVDAAANPVGLDISDPHAKDDVTTINQLYVPVNTKVVAYLSSKDVIHSLAIPVMRVKQDAVPGFTFPVWFEATRTGDFQIACAQLCGLSHYKMQGAFNVRTAEEVKTWLAEQRQYMMGADE